MPSPGLAVRIAILAPMQWELSPIARLLPLKRSRVGDIGLLRCSLGRAEIVATTTGIGTRAAALATESALESVAVDHLVVVGIAGGIGPGLAIGDLIVPELVIDLSTGSEHRPAAMGGREPRGTLATSDELLIDQAEVARLARQGVIAVDMETAAIAAVCERHGCPWSVFRAISDRADDGSTDSAVFGLAGPDGGPNLPALFRLVLANPKRVPQLVRLAQGLRLATNAAASAAVRALRKTYAI